MSREATAANSRERQLTGHDLNELYEPRSGGSNDEGPQTEPRPQVAAAALRLIKFTAD